MEAATIIGLDLAKRSFQTHGALGSRHNQVHQMMMAASIIAAAKVAASLS
jgi:hypothetical protein